MKSAKQKKELSFQNDYKILSSKKGGYILLINTQTGECYTIPALKALRTCLISLAIKEREEKIKEAA